jgi:hypothetical protein
MKTLLFIIFTLIGQFDCNYEKSNIFDLYFKNQKITEAESEFHRYLKAEFQQGEWKKLLVHKDNMIDNDFLNENIIKDVNFKLIPTYKVFSKKIMEYKNPQEFFRNLEPDTVSARGHFIYNNKVVGKAFLLYTNNKWRITDLLSLTNDNADYFNNENKEVFFIGVKNQGILYTHCFHFEGNNCYSVNTSNGEKVEFTKFMNTKYGSILKMGIDKLPE